MNYNSLNSAKFTWTSFTIVLFAVIAIVGAHFIYPKRVKVLPPIIEPKAQYCVELSEDGEVNWKRFDCNKTLHIIVNEGKLTGIETIDISDAK